MKKRSIISYAVAESVPASAWNEALKAKGVVRDHWASIYNPIYRWAPEERRNLLEQTGRMLEDIGTTFNVYRDVGGAGQPYEIDPIPLMLDGEEWQKLSKGLAQRQRLLEAVLADLYGARRLLKDGLLPPDLVHSSPAFHQSTRDIQPSGGKWLLASGCDLVRDAKGVWNVISDHTHTPGGLGQTLENRSVVSSVLSELFEASGVAELSVFFDAEHAALKNLQTSSGGVSNLVFLTPGYLHPSYFEHAYKARLLGVTLVEAGDLTVRERRLFLKTLGGLRRVDGVICRLEDDGIDPLEFWTAGGGGVPGIIEAWRSGNVALLNAPGSGFAGSVALLPFLPGICRAWFGEELLIPFVETWWLGQRVVRERFGENFNGYVLLSAFGKDRLLPVKWADLSASSRKQWVAEIARRPWDFVLQKEVVPSVAPSLQGRVVQDLPIALRAFTLSGTDGPVVMPGGLARCGKFGVPPQLWPVHEGFTKDVWLTGCEVGSSNIDRPTFRDRLGMVPEVPSRIAEQLYWVGRYSERVEFVARMLRVALRSAGGESGRFAACLRLMAGSGLVTGSVERMMGAAQLAGFIFDKKTSGGLFDLVGMLVSNAASARDRLSDDTWSFINQLKGIVDGVGLEAKVSELVRTLDRMLLHLAAFSGMQGENMIRGQGWLFLETGRRVERARGGLSLLHTASWDEALLEPLIEICDSVMTYRRRYFSKPEWSGVVELLFRERENPRSVAFQIAVIAREIENFPGNHSFGLFPKILSEVVELDAIFEGGGLPNGADLLTISSKLDGFSDKITHHYFSHSVRRVF